MSASNNTRPAASIGPIVSSAHLADGAVPALSEVEFGMLLSSHAFERWMVRCMTAAGEAGLTATEVTVLHTVTHRGTSKRLADICLVLGIEDTHLVTYAVRKLEEKGLVIRRKTGKEKADCTACHRHVASCGLTSKPAVHTAWNVDFLAREAHGPFLEVNDEAPVRPSPGAASEKLGIGIA